MKYLKFLKVKSVYIRVVCTTLVKMVHCFILRLLVIYNVKYHRLLSTIEFYFSSQMQKSYLKIVYSSKPVHCILCGHHSFCCCCCRHHLGRMTGYISSHVHIRILTSSFCFAVQVENSPF